MILALDAIGMLSPMAAVRAQEAVASQELWYHTIEVAPGVVTPGWFDLRPVMKHIPWPDVRGKRCLDIATYDGFLAFELERRGAAEVWATDLPNHEDWDWLPRDRAKGVAYLDAIAGEKGRGFEIASELRDSKVQRRFMSVYQLDPEEVGKFDVVVCGSLLLHLRDPMRALDAIRRVCSGEFLSIEVVDVLGSILHPRRATLNLKGINGQWTVPNSFGQRHMLEVAGFDVIESSRLFAEPMGTGHPPVTDRTARFWLDAIACRGKGVPVRALRTRPAI